MKVFELIKLLESLPDQHRHIEICISTYNSAYPVAYLPIDSDEYGGLQTNGISYRIEATLPYDDKEYMSVVKRQKK